MMEVKPELQAASLPILIFGGYLGAGKTSLVNRLLRQAQAQGRRLAVLVNDFGAINIDAALIAQTSAQLPALGAAKVLGLAGGCICCSFGADLVGALRDLLAFNQAAADQNQPVFEQVLIEASGVGIPSAIAQTARLLPEAQIQGTVVLVDASQILAQLEDSYLGDTVQAQLRDADLILANQLDRLPPADQADGAQHWSERFAARCQLAGVAASVVPVVLHPSPPLLEPQTAPLREPLPAPLQMMQDMPLAWLLDWQKEPDQGGASEPVRQGEPALRRSRWARSGRRGLRPARRGDQGTHRLWRSFVWQPQGPVDRHVLAQVLADPSLGILRAKGWLHVMSDASPQLVVSRQAVASDAALSCETVLIQAMGARVDIVPAGRPSSVSGLGAQFADSEPALVIISLDEHCDLAQFESAYQQGLQAFRGA